MTNTYWFRRKTTGYGWSPISWEGWLVTLGCLLLTAGGMLAGTFALLLRREELWLALGCYAIAIAGVALNTVAAISTGEPGTGSAREPAQD